MPETIEALSNAGLRIWVLTGDKMQTAISIARSCNLFRPSMQIRTIDGIEKTGGGGLLVAGATAAEALAVSGLIH